MAKVYADAGQGIVPLRIAERAGISDVTCGRYLMWLEREGAIPKLRPWLFVHSGPKPEPRPRVAVPRGLEERIVFAKQQRAEGIVIGAIADALSVSDDTVREYLNA